MEEEPPSKFRRTLERLRNQAEGLRRRIKLPRSKSADIVDRDDEIKTENFKPLPTIFGLIIPIIVLLLLQLIIFINSKTPVQLKVEEEAEYPDRFIGQRAEQYLKGLVDIGSRVVGSHGNEVEAVNYLNKQIDRIISNANSVHQYEKDNQRPTGSYYLEYKPWGIRNYYANIQNVVVRVSSYQKNSTHSVLVNCHYDTVHESPGATDDGINCAIMLELLTKISQMKEPLENNVIFLFNGAEENPLQASHGFITQHKWADEARVLINLEGAGPGGREQLFQTSYQFPWLTQTYADSVPHPAGSVTLEEAFSTNIIPSDSDFRIFRDYGDVPGFDFAYSDNGYVYHTHYDKMEYIPSGAYQHTGDNMLALLKALTSSPELAKMQNASADGSTNRVVYFDFFGLSLIIYTESFSIFWNVFCSVISLVTIGATYWILPSTKKTPIKSLLIVTGIQIVSWAICIGILIFIAKILDWANMTMSWYSNQLYIFPLYYMPLLYVVGAIPVFIQWRNKDNVCPAERAIQYLNSAQLLVTIFLIIGTCLSIRSMYITMLYVMFPGFGNILLFIRPRMFYTARRSIIVYIITSILPIMLTLYLSLRLFIILMPITGRMGPQVNPEIFLSVVSFYLGIHTTCYLTPLFLLFRSPHKLLATFFVVNLTTLVLILTTPLGFPYDGNIAAPALQRFNLIHTERTFYNQLGDVRRYDKGYWLLNLDRNSRKYVGQVIPEVANALDVKSDCEMELYCAAPLFKSRMVNYMELSNWIPGTAVPFVSVHTSLEIVKRTEIDDYTRRIDLKITGPDHMSIYLSPVRGATLIGWSFDKLPPHEEKRWNGRPTYFVHYSHGLNGGTIEWSMDLQVTANVSYLMDIAVVGHYMHDKSVWTEEYKNLLAKFPPWTQMNPWTATYKSWVIT